MFDLSKRGTDYDIHSDTKFINMMSGMGLNTQPVVNQSGDKGFIVQDQITNNKITIYPESLTQTQLKDQLRSLITFLKEIKKFLWPNFFVFNSSNFCFRNG